MGQVGHFKMTHLYHPPFHMAHPSRGTPLDAYFREYVQGKLNQIHRIGCPAMPATVDEKKFLMSDWC